MKLISVIEYTSFREIFIIPSSIACIWPHEHDIDVCGGEPRDCPIDYTIHMNNGTSIHALDNPDAKLDLFGQIAQA